MIINRAQAPLIANNKIGKGFDSLETEGEEEEEEGGREGELGDEFKRILSKTGDSRLLDWNPPKTRN